MPESSVDKDKVDQVENRADTAKGEEPAQTENQSIIPGIAKEEAIVGQDNKQCLAAKFIAKVLNGILMFSVLTPVADLVSLVYNVGLILKKAYKNRRNYRKLKLVIKFTDIVKELYTTGGSRDVRGADVGAYDADMSDKLSEITQSFNKTYAEADLFNEDKLKAFYEYKNPYLKTEFVEVVFKQESIRGFMVTNLCYGEKSMRTVDGSEEFDMDYTSKAQEGTLSSRLDSYKEDLSNKFEDSQSQISSLVDSNMEDLNNRLSSSENVRLKAENRMMKDVLKPKQLKSFERALETRAASRAARGLPPENPARGGRRRRTGQKKKTGQKKRTAQKRRGRTAQKRRR